MSDQLIGGEGIVVEVHEAKLRKQKNIKGRLEEHSWIFCAFERESKRCFFELFENGSADTVLFVVLKRITPGTTVISDKWRGYDPLQHYDLFISMINYSVFKKIHRSVS